MKYRHSLRYRIIFSFSVFGVLLSLLFGMLVMMTIAITEDKIFENRLRSEVNGFLARYRLDKSVALPHSAYMQGYLGTDAMPRFVKDMVGGLGEGYYETGGPYSIEGPENYHLAVKKMPEDDQFLYVLFDVGTMAFEEKYELFFLIILLVITMIVICIGVGVGIIMARKVIAPVTELAGHVATSGPDNLAVDLVGRFADDEIGLLASNLEQSMRRIQSFIVREKQFTRDASHELRTPLTVIKGALELIEQLPAYQEKSLQRPIRRIERSVKGMALTVETFLWLALEESGQEKEHTCEVLPVVRDAYSEYCDLFKDKMIETELHEQGCPRISSPAAVIKIVIDNLLRNAFNYTTAGKLHVIVTEQGIEFFNTGMLAVTDEMTSITEPSVRGKDSTGFGFGLAIVKRLCERFGWRLDIKGDEGTTVKLYLS
jgi:signal transduction histidine kinase